MAQTFTVDSDVLLALSDTLNTTADDLESLSKVRGEYGRELGNDHVAHEVSAFFQHWSDGVLRISEEVREIAKRLGLAAETYCECDCEIAQQAMPSGGA